MKKFTYTIQDEIGLHARPASQLIRIAKSYKSKITLINTKNNKSAEATKMMAIMALGIVYGITVDVTIEGEDEDAALTELKTFFTGTL
ncbi:MAG TPA: HPr family phosphocarrier protein [Treponema sp.]|nr:HPr family phosphocarrier protein [Treponema sp.]